MIVGSRGEDLWVPMNSFLAHFAIDGRLIVAGVTLVAIALLFTARSRMHRASRAVFSVFDLSASCISARHQRCSTDTRCPCKCHPHALVHAEYVQMELSNR